MTHIRRKSLIEQQVLANLLRGLILVAMTLEKHRLVTIHLLAVLFQKVLIKDIRAEEALAEGTFHTFTTLNHSLTHSELSNLGLLYLTVNLASVSLLWHRCLVLLIFLIIWRPIPSPSEVRER